MGIIEVTIVTSGWDSTSASLRVRESFSAPATRSRWAAEALGSEDTHAVVQRVLEEILAAIAQEDALSHARGPGEAI